MRAFVLLVTCCFLLTSPAFADEASHRASAERFLKLAKAEGMTAPVYEQVGRMLTAQFSQMGGSMQYESILRKHQQEAKSILDEELSWEAMREEMIDLYVAVFTEEELDKLSAFYRSEVGTKLMTYLPDLTKRSMAITQTRLEDTLAPRIEALVENMGEEIEAQQASLR
ncbi:hypothetical protein LCGC14_0171660 [marine sediment metagenome]